MIKDTSVCKFFYDAGQDFLKRKRFLKLPRNANNTSLPSKSFNKRLFKFVIFKRYNKYGKSRRKDNKMCLCKKRTTLGIDVILKANPCNINVEITLEKKMM